MIIFSVNTNSTRAFAVRRKRPRAGAGAPTRVTISADLIGSAAAETSAMSHGPSLPPRPTAAAATLWSGPAAAAMSSGRFS